MLKKSCTRFYLITMFMLLAHTHFAAAAATDASNQRVLKRWLGQNVETHPAVRAARASLDAASYQMVAADKALYNPELELDAENAETRVRSIGLSQTIDWGDTRGARTQMAGSQKAAAAYRFEAERRKVAVELLAGLSAYHMTSSLKSLAKQGEALMQRFAKLAKRRAEAGDLGQVEVDLANLSYAQARFKLADAISQHARARQNLIALTGSVNQNWPDFTADFPDPQAGEQNIEQTIEQLPRMRALTAGVAAAQAKVNVRAGEGAVNPTIAVRAGKEEQDNLLGITLSIPLQIRNNFKAEVDVANAEMIQAESESLAAFRELKGRLQTATVSYALSREAWLAWQASGAGSLNQQIELLERLWRAGELSTTDYLVQLKQALETKASAIEQRGRMWTDWSEWLLASGKIQHWLPTLPNTRESK